MPGERQREREVEQSSSGNLPRSLTFRTSGYEIEPDFLWPFSFGGDDDRPWTAESTFFNGSDMVKLGYCLWVRGIGCYRVAEREEYVSYNGLMIKKAERIDSKKIRMKALDRGW